jgi:hypothetical protein
MAILRSLDGQFYEVPDDQLAKFLIPADKVKEKVQSSSEDPGPPSNDPGPPGGGQGPAIIVQIYGASVPPPGGGAPPPGGAGAPTGSGAPAGEVQPYAWMNTWRNTYGPHWHNVWHNRW